MIFRNFTIGGTVVLVALVLAGLHQPAAADRITIDGETWNDVLIYKSSTMYYVKVPQDGTVFNVPINAVPPQNVEIVRDPWYRDELKERFEQNTTGARSTGDSVGASVFDAAVGIDGESEGDSDFTEPGTELEAVEADTAGGADPMAAIKATLQGMQYQLAEQNGNLVATSPDGSATVTFIGGSLAKGVEYNATVPEAGVQQLGGALTVLGQLVGQSAPWAGPFLQQEVAPLLQTGGTAEKSEGPVKIAAEVSKSGGNVTLNLSVTPNQAT